MAKKKKAKRLKTYFVQLCNRMDRDDNEAVRVKASSPEDAKRQASVDFHRFSIGYVIWAGSKNKWDRWFLKGLRAICSK